MGQSPQETRIIKEIADKLIEWAKRVEPKLPQHIGHLSFYGSLLKAIDNLPDLVLMWLGNFMPNQVKSIKKDFDDLYAKTKAVDHERGESVGAGDIAKCQAQAAAKNLAKKLRLLESIVESHREQFEIREKPAETEQKAAPAKCWGIIKRIPGWIFKKTSNLIGAIIVAIIATFVATILIDILGDFGWIGKIKIIIYNIFTSQ
jgi:hypothetical protein